MIGKGSFAKVNNSNNYFMDKNLKVYLAKKKEANTMYAIKAFSKQTL